MNNLQTRGVRGILKKRRIKERQKIRSRKTLSLLLYHSTIFCTISGNMPTNLQLQRLDVQCVCVCVCTV